MGAYRRNFYPLARAGRNVQSVEGESISLLGLKGQEEGVSKRGGRRVAAGGSHPRADKAFSRRARPRSAQREGLGGSQPALLAVHSPAGPSPTGQPI